MSETKSSKAPASVLALPTTTAIVLAVVIVALAAVYVMVPDHRDEIATAIGGFGAVVLAYMRGRHAGPALALLGALALGGVLSGCGASAIRVHATIASTAGASLDTWCQEEVARRDREQRAAVDAHAYQEDARAAVDAVRARYEPTLGGCTAAKGLHDGWVEGVTLGAAGAPFDAIDVARRFVAPLFETWSGIARASAQSDHPAPAPPAELVDLAQAVSR